MVRERDEVGEFLRAQGPEVQEMAGAFSLLHWGVREIKAFLEGSCKGGGVAAELCEEELMEELNEAAFAMRSGSEVLKDAREKSIYVFEIPYRVSSEMGKQYMRDLFAGAVMLSFMEMERATYNPHPVLRGVKVVVEDVLWRLMPKDARVLEVGPNVATAVKRKVSFGKYKGLIPSLASLDVERVWGAYGSMKVRLSMVGKGAYKKEQRAVAEDALLGPRSKLFKVETFQQNTWKPDWVFGADAFYDMSLQEVVRCLYKCGAKGVLGSLVNVPTLPDVVDGFDPEVRGQVGQTEQCWIADRQTDTVSFFFKNSSTRPYKHKLSQLAEYYRVPVREFDVCGTRFLFRKLPQSNEVFLCFSIERIEGDAEGLIDPKPCYRFYGDEAEVVMETSAVDMRFSKGDPRRVVPVSVSVGADSFSRVLTDRMARGPGKIEDVMNFARTNRVNIVHNGVRVSCERPIAMDQLRWFSVAIDALAVQLENSAEKDLKYVHSHISTGGWCTPAAVAASDPGLARSMWMRMIMGLAEAHPVSVRRTTRVAKVASKVEELEPLESAEEQCLRADERDAEEFLSGARGPLDRNEEEALRGWLLYSRTRACDCSECFLDESSIEDGDEFFDARSDSGYSSDSVVKSKVESVVSLPEISTTPVEVVKRGEAREAVEELLFILKGQMAAKEDAAMLNADRMMKCGGISVPNLAILDSDKTRHYGVRVGRMGILESTFGDAPELAEIARVYDPERRCFMGVRRDKEGRGWVDANASAVCYSNDDFLVWINPYIVNTLEAVLDDPMFGELPQRVCFVNGIWGSGKSYLAKEWFNAKRAEGLRPMFLGASRKPTEAVRKSLFGDSAEGKKWVKTIGSFLTWDATELPDVLVVDEVCMEHAAVVYAILHKLKPVQFWVCGDFMQMPYVPFLAGVHPKHASVLKCSDLALLNKGHRVPKDVYAAGLQVYGWDSGIHPCDCSDHQREEKSLNYHVVDSIAQVPVDPNAMYLTFGQATKENVRKFLYSRGLREGSPGDLVATMAEYQGGTSGRIIIVRDVRAAKKGGIYHEVNRVNVGGSRSTGQTDYYTVSRERDYLVQFCENGANEAALRRVDDNARKARESGEVFGLKELEAFLAGTLSRSHSALVGGMALKERMMAKCC